MYCIDPSADVPIMMLDRHIGNDAEDGMGIDGAAFAQELLQLDTLGKKGIDIYINCPGGSVIDGMNIYNAILKSNTPVDCYNVGIAASMGGVCFMAGRKRIMSDYASLMLHNPSGSTDKKAMDSMKDSICTMLSSRSGITNDDVSYLMDRTSWLNSAECFAKGFCTEIAVTSDANKKRMASITPRAMWKEATDIVNNVFKNNNDMKKITAKLNLNESASEESIVSAIETMQNSLAKIKNDSDAAIKAAEDKVTELSAQLATATAELATANEATLAAKEAAADTAAESIVNDFIKIGKITNDSKESWKGMAKKDFAGTKKLLEDLPLNKTAPVLPIINKLKEGELPTSAMGLAVKAKLKREGKI